MPRYRLTATLSDASITIIRKKLAEIFNAVPESFTVTKIEDKPSRAERMGDAAALLNDCKAIVEELRDEMREWHDNMPDNLKETDKAEQVDSVAGDLETMCDDLENIDLESIEWPGMF